MKRLLKDLWKRQQMQENTLIMVLSLFSFLWQADLHFLEKIYTKCGLAIHLINKS